MGIGLIAVAAVLLLGAGVMILVVNLGKSRSSSSATIDQIQTYGYVAETTGGSETESAARRPIDSLASRVGDWAARRSDRFGEAKIRDKLISAGMYGTTPRKILGYQVICAIVFSLLVALARPRDGFLVDRRNRRSRLRQASAAGSRRRITSSSSDASGWRRSTSRCRT